VNGRIVSAKHDRYRNRGETGTYLIKRLQHPRHPHQVPDRIIQLPRPLHEIPVHDLRPRDGRHHGIVVRLRRLRADGILLDDIHDVLHARFLHAEFLLVEAAVFDAADEVVEALALDDPVEDDFLAFFAEAGEVAGVFHFGDPHGVAEVEGPDDGLDALGDEAVLDVVPVCFGADLPVVQEEFHGEGCGFYAEGLEVGRTAGLRSESCRVRRWRIRICGSEERSP